MNLSFDTPWLLLGTLSGFIPWLLSGQRPVRYSSLRAVPDDRLSRYAERGLKMLASLSLIALAVGAAGPYGREQWVEKLGNGAQIVLVIDRSSSMSENFTGRYLTGSAKETKSAVARRLLSEFVSRESEDLFAIVTFSAAPIYVMPLTRDREAVLAAVNSSADRGHGVTNIASGLVMALEFFAGKPLTGSRIVLLVSDGAARIEEETRARLRQTFAETRARLYWIYLRNRTGVRLDDPPANLGESTTPEYFLHQFFQSLDTSYQAYQAENPEDLRRAIGDVEQLANEPLVYREKVPRRDLSTYLFGLALACLVPLIASRAMEIERWDG